LNTKKRREKKAGMGGLRALDGEGYNLLAGFGRKQITKKDPAQLKKKTCRFGHGGKENMWKTNGRMGSKEGGRWYNEKEKKKDSFGKQGKAEPPSWKNRKMQVSSGERLSEPTVPMWDEGLREGGPEESISGKKKKRRRNKIKKE